MTPTLPNEAHLYNDEYFDVTRNDPRRQIAYQQDAAEIMKRKPDLQVLFDIGGGHGEFGRYFDCEYFCYDPFAQNDKPNGKADVIVFRGTLQHIYNPIEKLAEARTMLRDDGLLAILATPDTDSFGYIRWGTLPALDPCRNWIPFGHRMLNNVLIRLGFYNIEFDWPYKQPYASPIKNMWNFITGKPDAFPGNMMECFAMK